MLLTTRSHPDSKFKSVPIRLTDDLTEKHALPVQAATSTMARGGIMFMRFATRLGNLGRSAAHRHAHAGYRRG